MRSEEQATGTCTRMYREGSDSEGGERQREKGSEVEEDERCWRNKGESRATRGCHRMTRSVEIFEPEIDPRLIDKLDPASVSESESDVMCEGERGGDLVASAAI